MVAVCCVDFVYIVCFHLISLCRVLLLLWIEGVRRVSIYLECIIIFNYIDFMADL
jgi:hypothetical protein